MPLTPPQEVTAPHDYWRFAPHPDRPNADEAVVFHGPDEGPDGFSVACGCWYNDNKEAWEPRLAVRWNANPHRPYGNPNSRNHPTWFILPNAMAHAVMTAVLPKIADRAARKRLHAWVTQEMKQTVSIPLDGPLVESADSPG